MCGDDFRPADRNFSSLDLKKKTRTEISWIKIFYIKFSFAVSKKSKNN